MRPKYTPENITELGPNEIFCFGSNRAGVHGAGAAAFALRRFGAVWGATGLHGQSYGLNTKDRHIETLPLSEIDYEIEVYNKCTKDNLHLTFYTTKIGCGLAGLSTKEIGDLFRKYTWPDNVILPKEFS